MSMENVPVVVIVRDPDFSNDIRTFNGKVEVYDIDCGRDDLRDPEEFAEWAEGHLTAADDYELAAYNDVADYIRQVVADYEPEETQA